MRSKKRLPDIRPDFTSRLSIVFLILLSAVSASAEAAKDIHTSDIVWFLFLAFLALFGWQLLVAFLIFYFSNRRGGVRPRNIWGTYGMSLLGSVLGFALVRNGPAPDFLVLGICIIAGIAGGFLGYSASSRVDVGENEAGLEMGRKFLEENSLRPEVISLPSGLQYEILREGNGRIPDATNRVTVHFEGRLIDGFVFDSSYRYKKPKKFDVFRAVDGWAEALQRMPQGSKWRLFIPSELGYGSEGAHRIPPNAVLIIDVELLDIA